MQKAGSEARHVCCRVRNPWDRAHPSLGIPDQLDHPLFLSAIERVATAGRRHGKAMAILAATVDQGRTFYEMGYDMICFSEDTLIYRDAPSAGLSE